MTNEQADLYFGQTHQPCGFTSGVIAQFDGSGEPVVRELLQNSLDAARDVGRPAEVHFVIDEVPKSLLPGWNSYQKVFGKAVVDREWWHDGKPSHDERTVIDHIREASKGPMIPVLLCTDNGHGLNSKRMDALLTQGNTSKGDQGAGSFGLGHHAAFGASDLRYVLYAARFRTEDGELASIASGHTILASHRDTDSPSGSIFAADGYWFRRGQGESAFDGTDSSYPSEPPSMLAPHLDDMHDTGTVVCIAGFNDFRRDDNDPGSAELICRVAAANFSAAVHDGTLTVRVEDERNGVVQVVTKESLESVLESISSQRKASKRGQVSGELAYNAWRTVSEGLRVEAPEGERLYFRHLQPSDQSVTRVHVFRRGMWIDSRVPGLRDSDFAKAQPFDAVLMLDHGPLEELVRNAEGPEHRGVDRRRLHDPTKRSQEKQKQLKEHIERVAALLRAEAGERENEGEFIPPGFATISGHAMRAAEPAPKPRLPSGGGRGRKPITGGKKTTGANNKKQRRAGSPRPGSMPRYRSSHRGGHDANTVEIQVVLDEEITSPAEVGIRLRLASGSDGSCEQPLADTWVRLREVNDNNGSSSLAGNGAGEWELTLPAVSGEQKLTITTAEPITQLELLELDLVKRKPHQEDSSIADVD
ncbi:MAG: hypothetical protein F4134_04020 [Acidimicrobiaceae bacterium]|nr:hypothetical protein [Acidimicrobiaceae bacterium]